MSDPSVSRVLVKTYTVLLHLCARRILPQQARALLTRMKEAGLPIDADCFHYVLDATAQTGTYRPRTSVLLPTSLAMILSRHRRPAMV